MRQIILNFLIAAVVECGVNVTREKTGAGWLTLEDQVPFPLPNDSSPLSDEGQLIVILTQRCPILRTTFRPVRLYEQVVHVKVQFQVVKLWGLDHTLDSFVVYGFVIAYWDLVECAKWDHDPYWNKIWRIRPSDFAQHSKSKVLPFWYPAIWQTNNKEEAFATIDYASSYNFITSYLQRDGLAGYDAPGKYVSFCELSANLSKFPFDSVTCSLQFQSWWPDISVRLSNLGFAYDRTIEHPVKIPENSVSDSMLWRVDQVYETKQNVTYGMHTYDKVGFAFVLKRKPEPYIFNIFVPAVALFVLLLAAFALPASQSQRTSLSLAVMVNFFILQAIVQDLLPESSETTVMTKYLVSLLWLGAFVMSYFCISLKMSKKQFLRRSAFPNWPVLAERMTLRTAIDIAVFAFSFTITVVIHIAIVVEMMTD